ncbi:ATP-dependent zinc metalloprotease FtsH [Thermobrachium celere]|uniref:ATP-dependent zinc metalloprotease FtsH n=1 Tax=Thermobrachium celere DSM 8682 TaxID=941824 RepID=R7RRB7_9CLOT|nr:ATP-dependent zinc metalloprotease FtsH [Thermobrachium celere]CDF57805.1 Cell division protein FtsH [Thermobrachium celere DSM 8682]
MNRLKNKNILIPILLLVFVLIIAFFSFKNSRPHSEIMYKDFIEEVQKGNVTDVYITNREAMEFKLKDGSILTTENPRSLNLKETLLLNGVKVHERSASSKAETIILIIIASSLVSALIYLTTKNSKSKGGAFKLSSIEVDAVTDTGITFENIAGNEEAKESIKELVDFIKTPEKYAKFKARMPRGVILYGPPGTGKTLMAKALATEANVPFFAVNGSDFVQIYVGVGAGRIRDLFKKAKEKGKAVIFIDEIDAIGKKRSMRADSGSDERDQTLNALLSEMSGFKSSDGIVVIAATNRLDILDEALLRPGRFDRHIEVNLPDVKDRQRILELYLKDKPLADDVDISKIAKSTVYFSGAKLENLVNEASILAAKENSEYITMKHLDKALSIVIAGAEKKNKDVFSETDRKITAYHEAGHALVAKLTNSSSIRKITIIPSTKGAGGYTLTVPKDANYQTKKMLLDTIKVYLAGRAAEEVIFGKDNITTGASNDIQRVTEIIISMIKDYGMFETSGLLSYSVIQENSYIDMKHIVDTANSIVKTLYEEVMDLINNNLDKLHRLANELLEKETIYEEEIDSILS